MSNEHKESYKRLIERAAIRISQEIRYGDITAVEELLEALTNQTLERRKLLTQFINGDPLLSDPEQTQD